MVFGSMKTKNHKNSGNIFFVDAGDGCYYCLNRSFLNGRPRANNRFHNCVNLSRVIFEKYVRKLKNSEDVHHVCLNKWCINFNHLQPIDISEHRKLHRNLQL